MFRSFRFGVIATLLIIFPGSASGEPIIIGSIHREAAVEIRRFLPFANYLGKLLQPEGINEARIVVAKDASQMAALLKERKVDLYIDSPLTSVEVSLLSGSKFLLRRWKNGRAEYRSVIFAKKDSNLHRLEDLKGSILAFEEPFSSTGYLIPKMALTREGLKLVPRPDPANSVNRDEIGYAFSLDDENTFVWVRRGKVTAGATDDQSYNREAQRHPNSLKVIYTSSSFPRHLVSTRADLAPTRVTRIKEILMQMDQSQDGRSALEEFQKTTKFDELPGPSMDQLLEARKFVEAEIKAR